MVVTGGTQAHHSSMQVQMADRDCSRVSDAGPPSKQRPSTASLPRRRSSSVTRSQLSPAAKAAQNGYFQRKAAKAMLERRRAAAASGTATASPDPTDACNPGDPNAQSAKDSSSSQAGVLAPSNWIEVERKKRVPKSLSVSKLDHAPALETKPSASSSSPERVIKVTVGADGVRIRDARRRGSDDIADVMMEKENGPSSLNAGAATPAADNRDAFFAARRRRSQREWKKSSQHQPSSITTGGSVVDDQPGSGLDEWDGSMPRRHSSRSFKDRVETPRASASAVAAVRRALETANASVAPANASGSDRQQPRASAPCSPDIRPLQSSVVPTQSISDSASQPLTDDSSSVLVPTTSPDTSASAVSLDSQSESAPSANRLPAAPASLYGLDHSDRAHAAGAPAQDCDCPKAVPECKKCADVAAFLTELVVDVCKQRAAAAADASAAAAEASTRAGGWRSVVMGDNGKARLAVENSRLSNENRVLLDAIKKLQVRFIPTVRQTVDHSGDVIQ